MRKLSPHTEWLSLVEVSGPFLTTSVLEKNFPQGLEVVDSHLKHRLRSAYEEWRDAIENDDPQLGELHLAWSQLVLRELFEFEDSVLFPIQDDDDLTFKSLDSDGRFVPDFALRSDAVQKPMLLICVLPQGSDLEKVKTGDEWPVSIHERMVLLCRDKGIRFGLITNGEQWMLVDAPIGSTSSSVSWYAHLWFQEEVTLKASQSLLGVRRWFGPEERSLAAMLDESLKHHEEVTDTLGEQVRRAVEVLVQSLDKADQDRNRELLENVTPTELYEAGLTVMMRLVFVLCAEERGLLLLGDPIYDQYYAITTLRAQLVEESEFHGHEVLERRHDGWARLLAIFRIIYGGIEHETLRMPALGGSLFDPDRFSFLEGRATGTSWKDIAAQPLPIDNRTVLLLLEALQVLEQKGGALLLSYRALDVEQIGHVYEGLLEYTVQRMTNDTLGLVGSQKVKSPNITLAELESAGKKDTQKLVSIIKDSTERSESAIENALKKKEDDDTVGKILVATGGDVSLANRIYPYVRLMRRDAWGDFIVYKSGSFAVTHGADRRETGTHYTPKSLTESIVETTLQPIVYNGPADDKPRAEWQLKSSAELLELKICDPAMGSGAFLVQVCRYLSERLVEAWGREETGGKFLTVDGDALNEIGSEEPMSSSLDERLLIARRLIAEKCLYGVDLNPLAVELAKLSIWLITLAKGRPFGFLDHNLRSGDSLLGLHKLEQLTKFSLQPDKKQTISLFASNVDSTVKEVIALRKKLRQISIWDIRDVQYMGRLDNESTQKLHRLEHIADAIIGVALDSAGDGKTLQTRLDTLSTWVEEYFEGGNEAGNKIVAEAIRTLSLDLPEGKKPRKPFHWILEFPEVFECGGFDGIVGNPPFMGGQKVSGNLGSRYREYLVEYIGNSVRGSADLVAYFFLNSMYLLRPNSSLGLLAVNTISEGDTRQVGLDRILQSKASVFSASTNVPWPGKAAVSISAICIHKGEWNSTAILNGKKEKQIFSNLTNLDLSQKRRLPSLKEMALQGSSPLGKGFIISNDEAERLKAEDSKCQDVIFRYLSTEDVTDSYKIESDRSIICFWDWEIEKVKKYPGPFNILYKTVRLERQKSKDKIAKEYWWRFTRLRADLYIKIGRGHYLGVSKRRKTDNSGEPLKKVIAFSAQASKYPIFAYVNNDSIFSNSLGIMINNSYEHFSVLNSTIFHIWIFGDKSSLETRLRFNPTDHYETFPFNLKNVYSDELEQLGRRFNDLREIICFKRKLGLTNLYNMFHDNKVATKELVELRSLQVQIDKVVIDSYGWNDVELLHGFHGTEQGIRFTISEEARIEVLQRLLKLNYEHYENEVRQGSNSKKNDSKTSLKRKNSKDIQSELGLI